METVTEMTFQYRLSGAESIRVELYRDSKPLRLVAELKNLPRDEWTAARCGFTLAESKDEQQVDEVRFLVPPGGQLAIDDLLLYAPS